MPRNVLVFQLQSTPMLFSRRNSLPACLLIKDLKVLKMSGLYTVIYVSDSLVPSPIPSFSMLHAEKREDLVCDVTCVSFRGDGWRWVIIVRG